MEGLGGVKQATAEDHALTAGSEIGSAGLAPGVFPLAERYSCRDV